MKTLSQRGGRLSWRVYWKQNAIPSSSTSHRVIVLHWNSTTCDSRVPSSFAACNLKAAMPTAGTTWPSFLESHAQCGNTMSPYPLSSLANFRYYANTKISRKHNGIINLSDFSFIQYEPRAFSMHPVELLIDTAFLQQLCDLCLLHRSSAKISKLMPVRSKAYLQWKATSLLPNTLRWQSNNFECTKYAGVREVVAFSLQHNGHVKLQISPVNLLRIYEMTNDFGTYRNCIRQSQIDKSISRFLRPSLLGSKLHRKRLSRTPPWEQSRWRLRDQVAKLWDQPLDLDRHPLPVDPSKILA